MENTIVQPIAEVTVAKATPTAKHTRTSADKGKASKAKATKGKAAKVAKAAPVAEAPKKVSAASMLRSLRAQYTALIAKQPKPAATHRKLEAQILEAEEAVYAHRVRRTQRPAKAGRVATRLGLTGVTRLA